MPAFNAQGAAPGPRMGEGTQLSSFRDVLESVELPKETEPVVQLVEVVRAGPNPGPSTRARKEVASVRAQSGWGGVELGHEVEGREDVNAVSQGGAGQPGPGAACR
jgi:hypothetical protein